MKRYLVFALLLLVAGVGLFRIHLIAKEEAENEKEVVQANEAYHPDKVFIPKKKPVKNEPVADTEIDPFASEAEETTPINPPSNKDSETLDYTFEEEVPAKEADIDLFAEPQKDFASDTFGIETEVKDENTGDFFDSDPGPHGGGNEFSANDNWNNVPQVSKSRAQSVPAPYLNEEEEEDDIRKKRQVDPAFEQAVEVLINKSENIKPLMPVVVRRQVMEQREGGTTSRVVNEAIYVSVFAKALQKDSAKARLKEIAEELIHSKKERELAKAWEEYESSFSPQGETDAKTAEEITEMNRRVLRAYQKHQQNIEQVSKELEKLKSRLTTRLDQEKLMARFLSLENSAELIYALELHEKLNANILSVKDFLENIFERKEDGSYRIKQSLIENLKMEKNQYALTMLELMDQKEKAITLLREELPRWSEEILPKDDLHREFKKVLMEPMFAVYALKDYGNNEQEKLSAHHIANLYFHKLDHQTVDTAEGLVIKTEFQPEIREQIVGFLKVNKSLGQIQSILEEFKKQVKLEDPFKECFSKWLSFESTFVQIAAETDLKNSTVEELVQNFFSEYFQKFEVNNPDSFDFNSDDDEEEELDLFGVPDQKKIEKPKQSQEKNPTNEDSKLTLRPERAELLNQKLQEWFQFNRDIRRKNRMTRALAANFQGEALKTFLESYTGTIILFEELEKKIPLDLTDGLNLWIEEHFTEENGKLVLKPGHEKAISEILEIGGMVPVPDPGFNDYESNTSFQNDSGFKRTNQSNAPEFKEDDRYEDPQFKSSPDKLDPGKDTFESSNDNAVPDYPDSDTGSGDDFFDTGENSQPLNHSRPQPVLDGDSKPVPDKKSKDPGGSKPVFEPENTTF